MHRGSTCTGSSCYQRNTTRLTIRENDHNRTKNNYHHLPNYYSAWSYSYSSQVLLEWFVLEHVAVTTHFAVTLGHQNIRRSTYSLCDFTRVNEIKLIIISTGCIMYATCVWPEAKEPLWTAHASTLANGYPWWGNDWRKFAENYVVGLIFCFHPHLG